MSEAATATAPADVATTQAAGATSPATTGVATTAAQTSGISEPWAKSWIKPDFSLDHTALERMPDHLKGMKATLEKYPNFEAALTGWQNQQVMAGKKGLAPLPSDAPPAALAERKGL